MKPLQKKLTSEKRIGFFAGAFDPIHDGHLGAARLAAKNLSLDKVYLMTEEKTWSNKNPIDIYHRQKMIDLCIDGGPGISQLRIKNKQFDIKHTLSLLEKKFPKTELYFLFGADVFMKMNPKQWPGLERLLKHYIVVFERGRVKEQFIQDHAKSLGTAIAILPSPHPRHSSSHVRLNPHRKIIWVPKKVAHYIDKNKLY